MMKVIGVGPDGLAKTVGEGVFGYGAKDGSLGPSAFIAPKVYANRIRQGVFWTPYSYMDYEAAEPELSWALEKRPGRPLFPGSSARGTVLIGPSMGDVGTVGSIAAMLGIAFAGVLVLSWFMSKS